VLVCGNHDLPWTGRSLESRADSRRWEKRYQKAFREVMHGVVPLELRDSNGDWAIDALASHFPRRGARRHGSEFDPWLVGCEGTWLLHGHTHSHRQMDVHEMTFHVGVDANTFTPVSEDRVVALILEAEDEFGYDMEANRA
jgi:calcineurin-like phosphoesterase family protein